MSYQVLARKWRPRTFAELVGQEHVVRALSNALEQQRLHHAYLFTGTRGVGKTTLARILAKSLNCESGITSSPCGVCTACREIDAGRFVDLIEVDAATNTKVDEMRQLLENAVYAPTAGRFKVYVIDEVHMLSNSAFNAMLKTLEEPPEHIKFILATTDPQKIPVTVLSRCLQFNLKQMLPSVIVSRLQHVLTQEGIAFEAPALQLLARAAQGSMRDALSLLDQAIAHGGGQVGEMQVRDMLGAVDQGYVFDLLEALAARDGAALIAGAERMAIRSLSFDAALQELGVVLHRIALAQTVPQALLEDLPERARILQLAQALGPEEVQLYYQIALHGRKDLGLAPDEFSGFGMTLLRMLAFAPADVPAFSPRPVGIAAGPGGSRPAGEETAVAHHEAPPAGAAEQASPPPAEPSGDFDGDWFRLAGKLKLGGMARMLAQHCELKNSRPGEFDLCVPEEHKHLLEKTYQQKLVAAIREHFGRPMKVAFSVGAGSGMTPREQVNREKQARQAEAVAAIEQDPFVRELVENLDARVIDSSIKPIGQEST